jgi:iron-sulfur cluster repair protein YtfE (RIC family)
VLRTPRLRATPPEDSVVEALAACHERIRWFAALAQTLAVRVDAAAADRAEAAAAVIRYFTVALPLHAADEDLALAPRLRALGPRVDDALAAMTAEHLDHAPLLAAVLAPCRAIVAAPTGPAPRELGAAADALAAAFATHLAEEEAVVFPAVAVLPAHDLAAIRAEMFARRAPPS